MSPLLLHPASHPIAVAVLAGSGIDAALGDEGLTRSPGWPHDDTADALRPLAEHPEHAGPGTFLVVRDGAVLGDAGWFGPPDSDGIAEIGYGLAVPARGQGLGTEAVTLLLAWVALQPGVQCVRAEVLPANEPSRRLLARLGFRVDGVRADHLVLLR